MNGEPEPTARQLEVLAAVLEHDGDRAAAASALCISRSGVKWQLREVYARLGIDGRGHGSHYALIRAARRLGWITVR